MRHGLTMIAGAVLAAAVSLTGAGAKELKGWSSHPEGYPGFTAMEKFGELIEERTDGKFTYKVFPSMTLGDENSAIDQTRFGVVDFAVFSLGPLSDTVSELQFLSLPYIFNSPEQMYRVMDGALGDEFSDIAQNYDLVILGWHGSGARSFYTRDKQISSPADLAGLKIRVQKSEVMADTMAAFGAVPTPLPFTEVFTAIKTGVVDGAENNLPSYESTGHFEVATNYSFDMHTIQPEVLVVSKQLWDSLSDEEKTIFKEAGKESTELQRTLWKEREDKSRKIAADSGVTFTEVDVSAFQDKVAPVHDKYLDDASKAFLARIKAVN